MWETSFQQNNYLNKFRKRKETYTETSKKSFETILKFWNFFFTKAKLAKSYVAKFYAYSSIVVGVASLASIFLVFFERVRLHTQECEPG